MLSLKSLCALYSPVEERSVFAAWTTYPAAPNDTLAEPDSFTDQYGAFLGPALPVVFHICVIDTLLLQQEHCLFCTNGFISAPFWLHWSSLPSPYSSTWPREQRLSCTQYVQYSFRLRDYIHRAVGKRLLDQAFSCCLNSLKKGGTKV